MMELQYKTNSEILTTQTSTSHRECQEWKVTAEKTITFSNSLEDTGRALTSGSSLGIIWNYIYTRSLPAQKHS